MKIRLFAGVLLVLLVFLSYRGYSQSSTNYLQLTVHTALNFSCSVASDFENNKTLSGAFSLKVKTDAKACNVYVKVSSYTVPAGFVPTGSPLEVDYTSTTSTNAINVATGPLALSITDQLLFTQPKTFGSAAYTFNYDFILLALGYDYIPGSYNYTLTFTMTQP